SLTFDAAVGSPDEARRLAEAEFRRLAQKFIIGEGTCFGKPDMQVGEWVELLNIGERFKGPYYLTQVRHVIDVNGYFTHFSIERNAA
ncbi:MAG: hypothetical protein D6814_06175, partial [Calditrichaeota bacterium]